MILTFRVSVPVSTPANNPLTHNLLSGASAIQSITIWLEDQGAGGVYTLQTGWRLLNRSGSIILPNIGSKDNFTFGNGEDGWSPVPNTPRRLELDDQVIEGPPYLLQFQFYNVHASILSYCGFVQVREPMATLAQHAMIYEFLTSRNSPAGDVSPETKTALKLTKTEEQKEQKIETAAREQSILFPNFKTGQEHKVGK